MSSDSPKRQTLPLALCARLVIRVCNQVCLAIHNYAVLQLPFDSPDECPKDCICLTLLDRLLSTKCFDWVIDMLPGKQLTIHVTYRPFSQTTLSSLSNPLDLTIIYTSLNVAI